MFEEQRITIPKQKYVKKCGDGLLNMLDILFLVYVSFRDTVNIYFLNRHIYRNIGFNSYIVYRHTVCW